MVAVCFMPFALNAKDGPQRIAIIKADDIRGVSEKWAAFFDLSKEKGVKVSAGVICQSLADGDQAYQDWIRKYQDSGYVEFWNHGWDHKRWETEEGEKRSEFSGSGYAHQKEHFEQSQRVLAEALGNAPLAFGSPFNAIDSDTERVMSENEDLRLFFTYSRKPRAGKLIAPMRFRGEHDGTGKPNFERFKSEYEAKQEGVDFTAIQFHPLYFKEGGLDEYGKIIDFLLGEGWSFVLPSEYVARAN